LQHSTTWQFLLLKGIQSYDLFCGSHQRIRPHTQYGISILLEIKSLLLLWWSKDKLVVMSICHILTRHGKRFRQPSFTRVESGTKSQYL
jgi:hypothetical protein